MLLDALGVVVVVADVVDVGNTIHSHVLMMYNASQMPGCAVNNSNMAYISCLMLYSTANIYNQPKVKVGAPKELCDVLETPR